MQEFNFRELTEEQQQEIIEAGVKDFIARFSGIMKELYEE